MNQPLKLGICRQCGGGGATRGRSWPMYLHSKSYHLSATPRKSLRRTVHVQGVACAACVPVASLSLLTMASAMHDSKKAVPTTGRLSSGGPVLSSSSTDQLSISLVEEVAPDCPLAGETSGVRAFSRTQALSSSTGWEAKEQRFRILGSRVNLHPSPAERERGTLTNSGRAGAPSPAPRGRDGEGATAAAPPGRHPPPPRPGWRCSRPRPRCGCAPSVPRRRPGWPWRWPRLH
jgi:hypothetical protein